MADSRNPFIPQGDGNSDNGSNDSSTIPDIEVPF